MQEAATAPGGQAVAVTTSDDWLFGWDLTPGIVSVWASRAGEALVWQRSGDSVTCSRERFRPWLLAVTLDDLAYLGNNLVPASDGETDTASISYKHLSGGEETAYRYLLSARDGRMLERAIIGGASRRRGVTVNRIHDLGPDYYRVGPVEQYLMLSGRTYFRGLAYADLHRLQFDLETTALSPQQGRIFLVAVRDTRGLATIIEAPTEADEADLIRQLCALIRERDPDVIENHNLFGFDLPFLYERARTLGVVLNIGRSEGPAVLDSFKEPGEVRRRRRTQWSIAGRELIDTLEAVWRHDFVARVLPGYGLKAVARHFGIAPDERTYIAGKDVYPTYKHDPAMVRRYALDDVEEVERLSERLLGASFSLSLMAPRRYERVASAGPAMGILEPMLVRAYLRAGAALPCQSANPDGVSGDHSGGATYLFAAGVAQQVVKADIASMYPSIMRVFRIGPSCDDLGVLLSLVERLTDLRLEHKVAARQAKTGSSEAGQHDAQQAAMKLLINSAYGYMGAGVMALFADRHAADNVTSTGRTILNQVLEALRERGMALLEADTDGVFFAVPAGWSEDQERALVADIAAILPAGIRLEYEGRYRAMLSHEVKNYALLTYEDELISRGVAFRSSRAEPFGARFLQQAIRYTLEGDVTSLRQTYQETIAALREGRFSASDVASRTRLAKTPEQYLASRSKLREAVYEALLAAGRKTWATGEWVRFYRGRNGKNYWLPENDEEAAESDADLEDAPEDQGVSSAGTPSAQKQGEAPYDAAHYINLLQVSYVSRLRKAFLPADFDQLFRPDGQLGMFDRPVDDITPLWVRAGRQDA